jgi:hypothetical protein
MERTRAALAASENAAGRQASKKAIGRLMDEMKHGIAALLLPPDPSRAAEAQASISTVGAAPSPDTSPLTCKGSVKRGLDAYNAGNYETAYCYWWPKAQKGDAAAQNNIGLLFENGGSSSAPQDYNKAAEWYLASAKQGLVVGMRNLARVQQRLGYQDAANTWLQMASATELQQAQRQYQMQQGLNSLGYALGCAMAGGCAAPGVTMAPVQRQRPVSVQQGGLAPLGTLGGSSVSHGTLGRSSPKSGMSLCPNGSYVSGSTCRLAPDGTYVGGSPVLAPDGTYVSGTPRLAPNGKYVGGTGQIIMCPDGTYVTGRICLLTPSGRYVGSN